MKSQKAHDPEDCERWEEAEIANTLSPRDGTAASTIVFTINQREEIRELQEAASLSGEGTHQTNYLLTSSAEASPARTSASPDGEPVSSRETAAPSSSSSPGSQMSLYSPEGLSSLRTYPDFFHQTVDEISPSYLRRWPSSGFTTSPGECWTADTSECPSGGAASSSLLDVLEAEVAPKYFLSPKAAAGIIKRTAKRGRTLPAHLSTALEKVASRSPLSP